MIFAHGFGCNQHTWSHVVPAFADDYKIVLFDYVGAGQSDLSAYDKNRYSTLNGYAQDIIEICEALDLKESIFVGHSVSCMIGMLAAIQQPSYFSELVFVSPSPRYINDESYTGGLENDDLDALLELMDNNYLGWASMLAPAVMGNEDRPELGESLTHSFCATNPEIARQFARVTFTSDNRKELSLLTVPSLTLQCVNDMLAPVEVGEYMNKHITDNELVILNVHGHCPHLSAPAKVINAIRAHLSQSRIADKTFETAAACCNE